MKKAVSSILSLLLIFNFILSEKFTLSTKADMKFNLEEEKDHIPVEKVDDKNYKANTALELLSEDKSISLENDKIEKNILDRKVSYTLVGNPYVGEVIDIVVNVENVTDFYGGSVDFLYDQTLIEVQSITKGDIFGAANTLTPLGEFGKIDNGQASFAITLQGNKPGVDSNGTLAIIKAKVLSKGTINLNTTNSNSSLDLDGNTVRVKLSNSMANSITYISKNTFIDLEREYNLNLGNLSVDTGSLTPQFSPEVTEYTVNIPYEANSIIINGAAEDGEARVEGIGTKKVRVGTNRFEISVIAPNGRSRIYSLNVNRDSKELLTANIGYGISGKNHAGKNFEINVTASNIQDLYSASLEFSYDNTSLEVLDVRLGDAFGNVSSDELFTNINKYDDKVTMSATLLGNVQGVSSEESTVFVIEARALKVGEITLNTVNGNVELNPKNYNIRTRLVGSDIYSNDVYYIPTTFEESYTFNILSTNNNLSNITVNQGQLMPEFSKENTYYEVNVTNEVTEIQINATVEDERAIVDGTGLTQINTGENNIELIVTAESGDSKTYTIKVIREFSEANDIVNIVTPNEIIVNTEEKEITLDVDSNTGSVSLEIEVSEGATWKLYSDIELTMEVDKENIIVEEGTNIFYINVIAENGINNNVYKFIVNREVPDRIAPQVVNVEINSKEYLPGSSVEVIITFDEPVLPGATLIIEGIFGREEILLEEVNNSNGTIYTVNFIIKNGWYGDIKTSLANVQDILGNAHESEVEVDSNLIIKFRQTDVNKDGYINDLDLAYISKRYNSQSGDELYDAELDFNNDGIIDLFEMIMISKEL